MRSGVSLVITLSALCPRTTPNQPVLRITEHHETETETESEQHKRKLHGMRRPPKTTGSSPPSDTEGGRGGHVKHPDSDAVVGCAAGFG